MDTMKTFFFNASIFCISLFLLVFQSCSNQQIENTEATIIHVPDVEKTSHLDSVFSTVSFLPLETDDDCLITRVVNLQIHDSLIYINDDRKRLLVFDFHGKFIRQIGARGKGHGEYLIMWDWIIDSNRIEILDYRRIKIYTLDGKYIKEKPFNLMNDKIYCNAAAFAHSPLGGYYLWGGSDVPDFDKDRYLMYEVDEDMKVKKGHFPIKRTGGTPPRRFSYYQDLIILDPTDGDYNIYQIDKKGEIKPRYFFDFGERAFLDKIPTPKKRQQGPPVVTNRFDDFVVSFSNFIETDDYIHLNFKFKNAAMTVLVNKANSKSYILNAVSSTKDEFRFWGATYAYNDQLIFPIDAPWFTIECERLSPEYLKELNIEDYKSKVNESDNPILVFYKLKK